MTAVLDARAEAMSELAAALLDALDKRSLDQLAMALAPRLSALVGEFRQRSAPSPHRARRSAFKRPTGQQRGFFKLPYAYFTQRWHKELRLAGVAGSSPVAHVLYASSFRGFPRVVLEERQE